MKLTFRPRTGLGKISVWGIVYFFVTWLIVALLQPRFGGTLENHNFLDWILIVLALTGMLGAFISLFGSLIAIVWKEDRSVLGIIMFVLAIPIGVLLAGFLLGSYIA